MIKFVWLYFYSIHPSLPLLATASGQRHFEVVYDSEDEDTCDNEVVYDNSVRLWWTGGDNTARLPP